jgi:hypothetical protein
MTKEDKRQYFLEKWINLVAENDDGTQAIYNAMAEYAEQECIGFLDWIEDNFLDLRYDSGGYYGEDSYIAKISTDQFPPKRFTKKELYQLYIQDKNKKP